MERARQGEAAGARIGFDIGGTFTDVILVRADGTAIVKKLPSSPDDYARAVVEGLRLLLLEAGESAERVSGIVHGTTVATNAILERRGARTGLITTSGFRDVLEIGRLRMPGLYNLNYDRPPPLVPRRLRVEIEERIDARGGVAITADTASIERAVDALMQGGVASIAVALLHAYANPKHEQKVAQVIRERAPELYVSLSSEVDPSIGEFERTSTVVANAYVMPVVDGYLRALDQELRAVGVSAELLIMQSSGGTMSVGAARAMPVSIIESGPAAGVVATAALALSLGEPNTISLDIGGTTAKAAVIENFRVRRTSEFQIGGPISEGSRLNNGGGFAIRAPAIDLAEVGAGGGSIVAVDAVGSLKIGPRSAGADPGPVAYDRGGTLATVTDANLVLGYLNPEGLPSGVALSVAKARAALAEQVAGPLGLSTEAAAYGIFQLATTAMARAVRAVTIEQGRDPRAFAMVAFGGNGPLFAVAIARALDIARVIVPPTPGVFSAVGLLEADIERRQTRAWRCALVALDPAALQEAVDRLKTEVTELLQRDGFALPIEASATLDMRYRGQSHPLTIPFPDQAPADALAELLLDGLGREHEASYGFRGDPEAAEIVTMMATARVARTDQMRRISRAALPRLGGGNRPAYFGNDYGVLPVALASRLDLARSHAGPLLIEEYDATTLVPPGASAMLDAQGNIVISTGA
jgi:N-methylhydantoinase A